MNGWKCESCPWIGTDPDLRRELDNVDDGMAQYVVVESCPDCGADDPLQVALCLDCADEGVDTLATHDDYCATCAAANFDGDDMEIFRRDQNTGPLLRSGT